MFAKLLKHEWKATSGLLGIFSLAALIAGVVGAVALRFMVSYTDGMMEGAAAEQGARMEVVAVNGLGVLLFFVMLALFAYYLGTQIVLLIRFYKNKFTDEGYLTFTLPVKSYQILGASWVNMLIWSLISALVFLTAMAVMMFCALEGMMAFDREVMEEAMSIYREIPGFGGGFVGLTLLSGLLEWIMMPLIAMTCITIGAVGAKKHKILLAIAVYYGYSMVTGIVGTVISAVVTVASFEMNAEGFLSAPLISGMLVQVLVALVCWFLTNYLINRKLNLP